MAKQPTPAQAQDPDGNGLWAATRPAGLDDWNDLPDADTTLIQRAESWRLNRPQPRLAEPDDDAAVVRLLRPPGGDPAPAQDAAPPLLAPALHNGVVLQDYRIDGVLGQGACGITYLAMDLQRQAPVAIKEYLPSAIAFRAGDGSVSPSASRQQERYRLGLQSFLAEARALAGVRHAAVVRAGRCFEANRTAYLVLAYERGTPFKQWWPPHSAIGEAGLMPLLLPLLDGLAAVHAAGFLHRDIKPDNIQVRAADGRLVLLDFGSAGPCVGAAEGDAVVLTPGYAAPEQYGRGDVGPWTDIYALGATLYAAVTGHKPPDAETRQLNPQAWRPAMEAGRQAAPGRNGARYSDTFLWAIDWALDLDPRRRPQSVAEWRRALGAEHLGSAVPQPARARGNGTAPADARTLRDRLPRGLRTLLKPTDWPLATQLTLALLAAALLPLLAAGLHQIDSRAAAQAQAEARATEQAAVAAAGRLSQWLADTRHLARALASDLEFAATLARPEALAVAAAGDRLVRIVQAHPDLQQASLLDLRGTVLASSDAAPGSRSLAGERIVQEAAQGRPAFSSAVAGAADAATAPAATPSLVLAQPVPDETGAVKGVLTLRLRGSALAAAVEATPRAAALAAFVVGRDGTVVHHAQPERISRPLAEPALAAAMAAAQSPGHLAYAAAADGRAGSAAIAGYAPVSGLPWVVGVSQAQADAGAPLQAQRRQLGWAVALAALVAAGLGLLIARSLVRPLRVLTQAARALQAGDYDQASVPVQRRDEIGQLGRSFQVMVEALRQRDRDQSRS